MDPTVSSNLNALARKEIVVDTFTYTAMEDYGITQQCGCECYHYGQERPILSQRRISYATGEKILLPCPGLPA